MANKTDIIATVELDYYERDVLMHILVWAQAHPELCDLITAPRKNALSRLAGKVADTPCGDPGCSICGTGPDYRWED